MAATTFSSLDSLNDPATKFVITPDSPSEMLARVVQHSFNLDRVGADPFIKVNGPSELLDRFKASKPGEKLLFCGWEPTVTQMTANGQYKKLIDSSKFRGYIVDVLVVSRDFLAKNEDVVRSVLESYFRANYNQRPKMPELVAQDAASSGTTLTPDQVKAVVDGIRWRNTQENYAHFGITSNPGYQHIDDMILNILNVLTKTGGIAKDPTGGSPNILYYDKILVSLFNSNFHPGVTSEEATAEVALRPLSDEEWKTLVPVGTLQVPPLVFARGRSDLIGGSEEILADLANKLKTWPQFYLVVKGHTAGSNTPENLALQKSRAETAAKWLVDHGIPEYRVKAQASESNGSTTVKFTLGQLPY